ncbi:hypothetical protein Rhal01_02086 [Rubritalea halochordaticola]|uniref:Ice-binding protein C-terminal domain-containing protein n=1 Tax=Rubritalea halochordaticola TaxID=714537 RepID=A0ABP9V1Q1_9BACT
MESAPSSIILTITTAALTSAFCNAAVVTYAEYDFGTGYTTSDSPSYSTADTSGNGGANLGTGSTGWAILDDGVSGNAFRQIGTTSGYQYMQNTSLLSAMPDQNWGIGLYFRVANAGQSSGIVMQLNGGGNGSPLINMEITAGNIYRTSISGNGNSFNYNSTFAADSGATVGEWDHLALINVNGSTAFYLNGVQVGNAQANAIDLGQINFAIKAGGSGELNNGDFDYFKAVTFDSSDTAADALSALAVPEPSSTALIGLAGLGFILRRKRA